MMSSTTLQLWLVFNAMFQTEQDYYYVLFRLMNIYTAQTFLKT